MGGANTLTRLFGAVTVSVGLLAIPLMGQPTSTRSHTRIVQRRSVL